MDGVLRGKVMSKTKFLQVAQASMGFCGVIFGWTSTLFVGNDAKSDEKRCRLRGEEVGGGGGRMGGSVTLVTRQIRLVPT